MLDNQTDVVVACC